MSTDVLYPVLIGVGCLLVVIVVHLLTRKRPSQSDINVPAAGTPDLDASQAPALALAAWHRRHEASVLDFIEHHDNQMASWADAEPAADDEQAGDGDDTDEVEKGADTGVAPDNDANTEGDDADGVEAEAESSEIEAGDAGADDATSAAGRTVGDEADQNDADEHNASATRDNEADPDEDEADADEDDPDEADPDEADADEHEDDEDDEEAAGEEAAEPDSIGDDHDPAGVGAALEAAADAHPGPDMRAELAAMRAAAEAAHLARGRDDGDAALRHRGVYAGYRGSWLERLQQFGVDNDRIGRLRRRDFPVDTS